MRLINAAELYYEDVECIDGNIYSVVHAPEIDNADDFDLSDHDKQIRDEVMIDTLNSVLKMIADWGYEDLTSVVLRENIKVRIAQLKGEQNE